MIPKTTIRGWIKNGVPLRSGRKNKSIHVETIREVKPTKTTLEDGTFVEAIMFQLYYKNQVTIGEWDSVQKKVEEFIAKEMEEK